ncbi:MAG: von Willebrand factor type A domain protein [bacterium ADurb.Bin363]|nr:MAG: von Willebrand factor type A domain protein [bacterium ADurb.Bin363]
MSTKRCPNCGETSNIDRNLVCHTCGCQLKLDQETDSYSVLLVPCSECKQLNSSALNFCSKCGSPLKRTDLALLPPENERKGIFDGMYARFVAVGLALLVGVSLTWGYYAFKNPGAVSGAPRIDVVFCIDTTGSMGDEIDVLKKELKNMVSTIQNDTPKPVVRFGVVAYRDRGDDYVVKPYDLTDNIQSIVAVINSLSAQGGGDHEESVNEALYVTVEKMNWDMTPGTSRMVFLIADAGPHMDYPNDYNYKDIVKRARSKNIIISSIGCSGLDSSADSIFREISSATNGTFDYLTYRQAFVDTHGKTQVILYQGDKGYVVNEKYADDSRWKDTGAEIFASESKAEVIKNSAPVTAGSSLGISEGASYKADRSLENNLPATITRQVQKQVKTR